MACSPAIDNCPLHMCWDAVRCDAQFVSGYVNDTDRYPEPELQSNCADLGQRLPARHHTRLSGAIHGCLAPQVGRMYTRGLSEPGKTTLAESAGSPVLWRIASGTGASTAQREV